MKIKEQLATAISLGDDLTPTEATEDAPVKLIYEFFDQFVKEENLLNQWAAATLKTWHTFKIHMESFGLALPVISNQKMNHYLKDLGELCGFTTPITIVCYRAGQRVEETYPKYSLIGTHAARRTLICFALSNGVPPQVVMKWTGHSDYKAMRPYIDIAEKTKADAMKLIDNAWGM